MKNKKLLLICTGIAVIVLIVVLVLCIKSSKINVEQSQETEAPQEIEEEVVEVEAEVPKKEVKEGRVYTGGILKEAGDSKEVLEKWKSMEATAMEETPGVGEEEQSSYPSAEEEQDLVLEKGEYLFLIDKDEGIRIVENTDNGANDVSFLKMEQEQDYIRKATICGNLLIVICNQEDQMAVYSYDIADPKTPLLKSSMTQDGNYYAFRMVDGYLYLFSQIYQYQEDYVPSVQGMPMEAQQIYIPKIATSNSYLVMTATSIEDLKNISDQKAVMSIPTSIALSNHACYLDSSSWNYDSVGSCLVKIEFSEGEFNLQNSVQLAGYITDDSWVNQQGDILRIFTTDWDGTQTNRIYTLDDKMTILGRCDQVAENEVINAVRFTENIVYLVANEAKEPLVAVDLTNPEEITITEPQKISGFDGILYTYGEDKILGISSENGIKLCMYNMQEEPQIQVLGEYQIALEDNDSELANNQMFYINRENNRIGLAVVSGEQVSYQLFSYDEQTNTFMPEQSSAIRMDSKENDISEIRGILVGNNLYIIRNLSILGILFDVQK